MNQIEIVKKIIEARILVLSNEYNSLCGIREHEQYRMFAIEQIIIELRRIMGQVEQEC